MSKTSTPTKYMVYRMIKKEFGIALTNDQLNTIDDVYLLERKSTIFKVGMYRFINGWWSILLMIGFWFIKGKMWDDYAFVILMALFLVYNVIHIWNNIVEYRAIKTNKLTNADVIE